MDLWIVEWRLSCKNGLFFKRKVGMLSITGIQGKETTLTQLNSTMEVCCHCTGWRNCGCCLCTCTEPMLKVSTSPYIACMSSIKETDLSRGPSQVPLTASHKLLVDATVYYPLHHRWLTDTSQRTINANNISTKKKCIARGLMLHFRDAGHYN